MYAEDIQPQMIDAIKGRVERENLSNVVTVLGSADDPRLPPGIDAALIVGSYHEMQFDEAGKRRDPVVLLKNIARSLKPQGRLGVVDFRPGAGGPGPDPDQRVDPEAVIRAAAAAGLAFISRDDVPPFEYLLIFGRSSGTVAGAREPPQARHHARGDQQLDEVGGDERREADAQRARDSVGRPRDQREPQARRRRTRPPDRRPSPGRR